MKKIINSIKYFLTKNIKAFILRLLFILMFISPPFFLAIFSFIKLYNQSTSEVISQKKSLAYLSSNIVQEKLDGVLNLGISLATRPRFIEEIKKNNWKGAINTLNNLLDNFTFIDRIVLYDTSGIIKADNPSDPDVLGQSRADRSWYKDLKRNWEPYISEVYLRGAKPFINVISVMIPIRKNASFTSTKISMNDKEKNLLGILQLQLKLNIFQEWIKEAQFSKEELIYIVDQYGHIVYHPKLEQKDRIIDFSSLVIIQKLIKGISGAELNYNIIEKEERVAAYESISEYGWGVVVTEPVKFAFAERNKNLRFLLITYSLIIFLSLTTALILLFAIIFIKKTGDESREIALIVESSNDAIFSVSLNGVVLSWNKGAELIYGYKSKEMIGKSIFILSVKEAKNEIQKIFKSIKKLQKIMQYEILSKRKDGKIIIVSITISPIANNKGDIIKISIIAHNITELKNAEEKLLQSKEEYRNLVENIYDWVWSVDKNGIYTYSSNKVFNILGYKPEELIGKSPFDFMTEVEAERVRKVFKKYIAKKQSIKSLENINIHKKGHLVVLETSAEPIISSDEKFIGYRGVDRDITKRKQVEEKLRELSLIDDLTGLNNRRGFLTFANQQIKIAERLKQKLVLIYSDLDNMKYINDKYGHKEGDKALIDTAIILKNSLRASDIIARLGGDEFVSLALETIDYSGEKIMERLKENINAYNLKENRKYELSMSFGMSFYNPDNPCSLEKLLEQGDKEMYINKQKKGDINK